MNSDDTWYVCLELAVVHERDTRAEHSRFLETQDRSLFFVGGNGGQDEGGANKSECFDDWIRSKATKTITNKL